MVINLTYCYVLFKIKDVYFFILQILNNKATVNLPIFEIEVIKSTIFG